MCFLIEISIVYKTLTTFYLLFMTLDFAYIFYGPLCLPVRKSKHYEMQPLFVININITQVVSLKKTFKRALRLSEN